MSTLPLEDTWLPLERHVTPRTAIATVGDEARRVVSIYDYTPTGRVDFHPWVLPELPEDYGIGVIVGGSGSGKSTLLASMGEVTHGARTPLLPGLATEHLKGPVTYDRS